MSVGEETVLLVPTRTYASPMRRVLLVCPVLLVGIACGTPFTEGSRSVATTVATTTPQEDLFEYVGTVLESDDRGPRACAGFVLTSLPPQCGGLPLVDFDWDAVPWAETAAGSTWADVLLTGRFDGERFIVTAPPILIPAYYFVETSYDEFFIPPCDTPSGGWSDLRPQGTNAISAQNYAQAQPDFGEHWLYRPIESRDEVVQVFTFTGDLAAHTSALEALYDGAICVGLAPRSRAELNAILEDLQELLWSSEARARAVYVGYPGLPEGAPITNINGIRSTVNASVMAVVDEAEVQAWLDSLFGEGVVVLSTVLKRPGT